MQIIRPDRGGSFIDALTFCLVVVLALSVVLTPAWAEEAERYNSEGVGHFNKGDYDAALASFKEASRLNPDLFLAHYNLGVTYGKKGQWDASIDSFKEVIRLEPDIASVHFALGEAYAKKGDRGKALAEYEWLRNRKPDWAEELLAKIPPK